MPTWKFISGVDNGAGGDLVSTNNLSDVADAPTALSNLGGQPSDAELTALAGLTSAADKLPYFTGSGTADVADFSAYGRSLVDDADAASARTTLGLVIGTDVQAQDSQLQQLADLADADGVLTNTSGTLSWATSGGASSLDELSDVGFDTTDDNLWFGNTIPGTRTTGIGNIALSSTGNALDALSSGSWNFAVGEHALGQSATGIGNIAIGRTAANTWTNSNCVAIGHQALQLTTGQVGMVAIGKDAGQQANASFFTAVGESAGRIATGNGLTAIGAHAGDSGITGARNTIVGAQAATTTLTSGADNTIVGYGANVDAAARTDTVVIGQGLTSGAVDGAIAIGSNNVPGNIIRVESGVLTVGGSSVGGASDLDGLSDVGVDVTNRLLFVGADIPGTWTTGTDNISISADGTAFAGMAYHSRSVAIGSDALNTGGDGYDSVAIGYQAMQTRHSNTVAIGSQAAKAGPTNSTAVGYTALLTATGARNTAVGALAGNGVTTGTDNTIVGQNADVDTGSRTGAVVIGRNMTSGAEDGAIAIGYNNVPGNIIRVESGVLTVGGVSWVKSSGSTGYTTPTNLVTTKTFDADATTLDEIADVLGTLIEDLKTAGAIAA